MVILYNVWWCGERIWVKWVVIIHKINLKCDKMYYLLNLYSYLFMHLIWLKFSAFIVRPLFLFVIAFILQLKRRLMFIKILILQISSHFVWLSLEVMFELNIIVRKYNWIVFDSQVYSYFGGDFFMKWSFDDRKHINSKYIMY